METFEELGSAHPIRSSPIFVYIHHKNLFRVGNVLTTATAGCAWFPLDKTTLTFLTTTLSRRSQ